MASKKSGRDQPGIQEHQSAAATALAELPQLAVAFGDCEFLRARTVADFRDAWLKRYPDGDIVIIRGAGESRPVSLADIIRELSGGSLFAKDKLVIVRQAERLLFASGARGGSVAEEAAAAASGGEREKAFIAWLENPASRIWLVMDSGQLPRNRTLGKRLAEKSFLIPCPLPTQRELPFFLSGRAAELGRRLDDAAADLLIRAHGADLGVLSAELDKLTLYAADGQAITAEMVGEFLTGTIEFDIFNFTNAIEAKDKGQAIFYARRISEQGTRDQKGKKEDGDRSAHKVIFMLASSLENMLKAGVARTRGVSPSDFAAVAKLSPWRAEKVYEAAARYSVRELRLMLDYAADQMRRSHDTGGDAALSLELMAVKFSGGVLRKL